MASEPAGDNVFDRVLSGLRGARSRLLKDVSDIDNAITALEQLADNPDKFKAEVDSYVEAMASACCAQHGQRCFAEGVTEVCCVECPRWKMEVE